ncbi:MAG: hypothetical protein VKN72_11820 [Nostocales cyanobacterium 94392]|nr:hypothetical protein [Nostocales cyanobacterium 94392]
MNIIHELEGKRVDPVEARAIVLTTSYANTTLQNSPDTKQMAIKSDGVTLKKEDAIYFNSLVEKYGTSLKLDYKITFVESNVVLNYFIDMDESPVFYTNYNGDVEEVQFKVKSVHDFNDFYNKSKSLSFSLLNQKKPITSVPVKYKIISHDWVGTALNSAINVLSIGFQTLEYSVQVILDAQQIIAAATPAVGVGAVVTVGQIIFASIQLVVHAALIAVKILQARQQGIILLNAIHPKTREFKGTRVIELIRAACEFLNFGFKSNYMEAEMADWVILPVPMRKSTKKGLKVFQSFIDLYQNEYNLAYTTGHPTSKDFGVTDAWMLIDHVCNHRKLECHNINGVIRIEPEEFFINLASLNLQLSPQEQGKRLTSFTLNVDEKWKRTIISYKVDPADFYTRDDTDALDVEYSEEITNNYGKEENLHGLQDREYPFALGKRLEKLPKVVEEVKKVLEKIDKFTGSSFASKIKKPKGELVIDNQYFTVPKLLIVDNAGYLKADYKARINPSNDWDKGIYKTSITKSGAKIIQGMRFILSPEEYLAMFASNYVKINGVVVRILISDYSPYSSTATIMYREKYLYEQGKIQSKRIN